MAFTFFFRDLHTLEHVARVLVPEVSGRSRIRIWDAGCAMGQEPYTLAMVLAENMGNFSFKNLYITATDIDEQDTFCEILKKGVYLKGETERIPPEITAKYFEPVPGSPDHLKVVDFIKDRVQFQKHNLLSLEPIGTGFSLILCKNVLLHLKPEERVEVFKMYHKCLASGGIIAIENTQKLPAEVADLFTHIVPDSQIFRKVD